MILHVCLIGIGMCLICILRSGVLVRLGQMISKLSKGHCNGAPNPVVSTGWGPHGPPFDSVQLPNRKVAECYGLWHFMVDIT